MGAHRDPRVGGILAGLRRHGSARNVAGMARYGIRPRRPYGVSIATLRPLARQHRGQHELALALWETGVHEARILAAFIDDPAQVTRGQMEAWARGFDSWDLCDQVCGKLFDRTPFAREKALAWSSRRGEYVRRAGFVLMASLAVHDKEAPDAHFRAFLPVIARASTDERNYVRKAVNWALRQIGKRNRRLREDAIRCADRIARVEARSARWIAADALRELRARERG